MSPAQREKQLIKNYFLALSSMRESQQMLFAKDFQVTDVGTARMKLVVKNSKLDKLTTKS